MKKYEILYKELNDDDRAAVDEVFDTVIMALHSKSGAVVLLADLNGEGQAACMCIGNALLVQPLLHAGAAVAEGMSQSESRMLQ